MNKNIWLCKIEKGELSFGSETNEARFNEFAKKNEGKTLRLSYEEPKRSDQQHRYYFLYLGVISRETGDDVNSLHEYFKRTFLPPKIISVMGKEIKIPASTRDLKKAEFGEYLDRICAETEIPLPDIELAGYFI